MQSPSKGHDVIVAGGGSAGVAAAVSAARLGAKVALVEQAVKRVLDDICREAGVDVLLHSFIAGADRENGEIKQVRYQDHEGLHEISGHAFVDASGEGDLAWYAILPRQVTTRAALRASVKLKQTDASKRGPISRFSGPCAKSVCGRAHRRW